MSKINIKLIIKLKIINRIRNIRGKVYKLVNENEENKILFIGDKNTLYYIASLYFSKKPTVELIDKIFIWNLKKFEKKLKQYNTIFVKTDGIFTRFLQKKGFFILPEWIEIDLHVTHPFDKIIKKTKKSAKEDIRKIKKFKFNYKITTNKKEFEKFYNEIYKPFIISRHRELTIPEATDYKEIKNTFENGKLLLVNDKGKTISGGIIHTYKKTGYLSYVGVKTSQDYLNKCAGSAVYYFFIKWSKEKNLSDIKLGGTRPFLNDGLFQYKKKWNTTANFGKDILGIIGITINGKNIDFLKRNPFIFIDNKQLKGFLIVSKNISKTKLNNKLKRYEMQGIKEIKIIKEDKINSF